MKPFSSRRLTSQGHLRVATVVFVLSVFVTHGDCSSSGGYFLFTPPFGISRSSGRTSQELTDNFSSRRSDSSSSSGQSRAITNFNTAGPVSTGESLWVGSHKINWSPLPPLLLKFADPAAYHLETQKLAQSRQYELPPTTQTPSSYSSSSSATTMNYHHLPPTPKTVITPPPPPTRRRASKFSFGLPLFGFNPFGPTTPTKSPKRLVMSQHGNSVSASYHINDQTEQLTSSLTTTPATTPLPLIRFSSTPGIFLVSPPPASSALSSQGPSIRPIIDKLKKMTQWSKKRRNLDKSKEDVRPTTIPVIISTPTGERRIRLLKKVKPKKKSKKAKKIKPNIAAIIMSNDDDDEDDEVTSMSEERYNFQREKEKRKTKSRIRGKSRSRSRGHSKEVINARAHNDNSKVLTLDDLIIRDTEPTKEPRVNSFRPSADDFVIIHPTAANAVSFLDYKNDHKNDNAVGQTALKNYEHSRKDKKLGLFRNERFFDTSEGGPEPFAFRFGPEDAKMSPYLARRF